MKTPHEPTSPATEDLVSAQHAQNNQGRAEELQSILSSSGGTVYAVYVRPLLSGKGYQTYVNKFGKGVLSSIDKYLKTLGFAKESVCHALGGAAELVEEGSSGVRTRFLGYALKGPVARAARPQGPQRDDEVQEGRDPPTGGD